MADSSINQIFKESMQDRHIPKNVFLVVICAYLVPITMTLLFNQWVDWLWLLYMIPALILAYYHGLKGSLVNITLSGCLIGFVEIYKYYNFGDFVILDGITNIYLGTIFSMLLTTFIVALLAQKLQLIRDSSSYLLENMNTALIIVDKEEKLIYANQLAAELREYPMASQILGRTWSEFCPLPETRGVIRNTLITGVNYSNHEIIVGLGNEERYLLFDSHTLRNELGEIIGVLVSIKDITEEKRLQQKAHKSERFNALGEIAAGLAHEIRNPLTSISGYLQLLEKRNEVYNQEHSEIMVEELNKIKRLLTEFLVLAKPKLTNKEVCYVEELLEDVINFVNCEAILYDIEIRTQIMAPMFKVRIDKEQIKQAIINIMQNSIEAMPKGGILTVTCGLTFSLESKRGEIAISIQDTGTGIDKVALSNIYNPFYTTKEEGTGLGLSVSYKIIEDHNGSLNIESVRNRGTVATITLPVFDD